MSNPAPKPRWNNLEWRTDLHLDCEPCVRRAVPIGPWHYADFNANDRLIIREEFDGTYTIYDRRLDVNQFNLEALDVATWLHHNYPEE